MTREGLIVFGPEFDDGRLLQNGTVAPTDWSFVAATAEDAHAPPDGTYWLKAIAGATANVTPFKSQAITPKTYQWPCLRGFVVEGTLDHATPTPLRFLRFITVASSINLEVLPVSASTWKIRLTSTAARVFQADGANALNTDDVYAIRVGLSVSGANTLAKVWVNGTLEITKTIAGDERIDDVNFRFYADDLAGDQIFYWRSLLVTQSNTEADRPNTDVEVNRYDGDGERPEQDFGDQADCTTQDAVFGDVALDGGDGVDTAIYWCEDAAHNGTQMMTLTNPAFTEAVEAFAVHACQRANTEASKTVSTWHCLDDGVDTVELQNTNAPNWTWRAYNQMFLTAPDGGLWQAATMADINMGGRFVNTNTAHGHWAALVGEGGSTGDDPPPTAVPRSFGVVIG